MISVACPAVRAQSKTYGTTLETVTAIRVPENVGKFGEKEHGEERFHSSERQISDFSPMTRVSSKFRRTLEAAKVA